MANKSSEQVINLFEYRNKVSSNIDNNELEAFLDEIWQNREKNLAFGSFDEERVESQRFLQFLHKTNELKSTKYVGVINFNGHKINLLPKIFYEENKNYAAAEVCGIHYHILWWLSYCRRIRFPNFSSFLGSIKADFFEVLIFMFAKTTRNLLSSSIFQHYQETSRELGFIKGRLETNDYIRQNLSTGRWNKLNCSFELFDLDNQFNRIIKYVVTLLFNVTTSNDSKKILREILFILDEVADVRATAIECRSVKLNPMFADFEVVKDYCCLFLSNSVSFSYKSSLKLFVFLLPMEYIFEDFITGFIQKELPELDLKSQSRDVYLDESQNFCLRPDLVVQNGKESIIVDTKYKIVYEDVNDPKKGISQGDLYQMLAYAVRYGINCIKLFYPETIKSTANSHQSIVIKDVFAENVEIRVSPHHLPIINKEIDPEYNLSLEESFCPAVEILRKKLREILLPETNQGISDSGL